jgi:hypothetical protein
VAASVTLAKSVYHPSYADAGASSRWRELHVGDVVERGALVDYRSVVGRYLLLITNQVVIGNQKTNSAVVLAVEYNGSFGRMFAHRLGNVVRFSFLTGASYVLLPS